MLGVYFPAKIEGALPRSLRIGSGARPSLAKSHRSRLDRSRLAIGATIGKKLAFL
jgi:hypothetical protein